MRIQSNNFWLSFPRLGAASSIPRKKGRQRWTCGDPRQPWSQGYGYRPYLRHRSRVRCTWRWSERRRQRGRRRRQRPRGQRRWQPCTEISRTKDNRKVRKMSLRQRGTCTSIDRMMGANWVAWLCYATTKDCSVHADTLGYFDRSPQVNVDMNMHRMVAPCSARPQNARTAPVEMFGEVVSHRSAQTEHRTS